MMEFDANALYVLRKHTDLKAIYGEAPNAVLAARKQLEKQAQVVSKTLAARGRSSLASPLRARTSFSPHAWCRLCAEG